MKRIDLNDDKATYDTRLHVEDDREDYSLAEEAMDFIERRMREMNGDDQTKPVCGGCVFGIIGALPKIALKRGEATVEDAIGWMGTMRNSISDDDRAAKHMLLTKEPGDKVWKEGEKFTYVRRMLGKTEGSA